MIYILETGKSRLQPSIVCQILLVTADSQPSVFYWVPLFPSFPHFRTVSHIALFYLRVHLTSHQMENSAGGLSTPGSQQAHSAGSGVKLTYLRCTIHDAEFT